MKFLIWRRMIRKNKMEGNLYNINYIPILEDIFMFQPGKMTYRNFGNSGLKVSAISMGNMINVREDTYEEDKKIIEVCLKNGINHFDTAEVYSLGNAELQLGKILKDLNVTREEVVISTKVYTAKDPDINSTKSTNRKHIRESIKKSLQRLQLDYVDILYAHIYDYDTPLEEACRAFHEVIEQGLVFYWATSNWEPEVVLEALAICEKYNLHKPIGGQDQYNMLVRKMHEVEYESLFTRYNYGLIAWSPLAGGFLTGKYLNGISETEVNRMNDPKSAFPIEVMKTLFFNPHSTENTIQKLRDLSALAESLGFKLTHLAIAWVIKFAHTSSALIGARNVAQLEDSLRALDLLDKLTPELEAKVNKILGTTPATRMDCIAWRPYDPIRPVAKQ